MTGIPWIDGALALGGLIVPPLFNFVKNKFGNGEDTPEATMGNLATTNPEVLPNYVTAMVGYLKAQVEFFNRDVIGAPSQWVVDLRASIRPASVVLGFFLIGLDMAFTQFEMDPGVRYFLEVNISSWFGSRLTLSGSK